jgi:hypothetical protein
VKLRGLAGLICCTALLGLPAVAQAKAPIPTTITRDAATTAGTVLEQWGHISSPNPKCLGGRLVRLFYTTPSGEKLVDTDRTSANGIWAAGGDNANFLGVRYKVTKRLIGHRGHRRTCAAGEGEIND